MEYMGCYKSVVEFINSDVAGKYPFLSVNKEKYDELPEICATVDRLVEEYDAKQVDVEFAEHQNELSIRILTEDMIFEHDKSCNFFELIQKVSSFSFSGAEVNDKAEANYMWLSINIFGLWNAKAS